MTPAAADENHFSLLTNNPLTFPMKRTTKAEKIHRLYSRLAELGFSFDDSSTLIRAERTLARWGEAECNGDIQRDEKTNIPWRYFGNEHQHRCATPDREAGALRRVTAICERAGAHFYHQTDPRGCSLYVSREPLTDNNYNNGIAVCID